MKYSFRMTEQEYLDALAYEIRKQRSDPLNLIAALICTVVQLGFVVFCIASGILADMAATATCLASCALFAGMTAYQLAVGARARAKLNACRKAGYLYQDFSSPIRLSVEDGVLRIGGGKNKLSYDCAYLSEYGFVGEILALTFRRESAVHRILVPVSAFGGRDGAASFAEKLSALGVGRGGDGSPEEAAPLCVVRYESTEAEFAADYVRCCRAAYRTGYIWTASFVLKLALAALLIWYVANGTLGPMFWDVVACVAAFLLLQRPIAVFSPLMRVTASRYAKNLYGGRSRMTFTISVTKDAFSCFAEGFCNRFPLDRVLFVEKTKTHLFTYLKGGVILSIPLTAENATAASRCYLILSSAAESNRAAKKKWAGVRRG